MSSVVEQAPDTGFETALEGADIVLSAGEFVAQMAAHERNAARLALALRRLETTGELGVEGALTTRAWLRDRCRMTDTMAGRWVAQGRFLDRFDSLADLALSGAVSAGQVETVRAFCPPRLQPLLDQHHRELVPFLAALDAEGTVKVMDEWRKKAEAIVDADAPPSEADRSLRMTRASDGALLGTFELHGGAAAEVEAALKTAATFEGEHDTRTKAQRDADALHDICAFFNRQNDKPATKRRHPHVELSLRGDTLVTDLLLGAHPETGRLFDHDTTETVLCDCLIHQIMLGTDELPIGYGRARYTVPRHLFRLTAERDGGCRFPGCKRPAAHCDAHHLRHWRKGGLTEHSNLGLLCNRHHHIVHRENVEMKLLPSGEMHFTWPDGTHRETQPRGKRPKVPLPPV
jgi:hypothetical protein